jgi:hypothetical protein
VLAGATGNTYLLLYTNYKVFKVFMAVKIQVKVFWAVTLCSVADFGGPGCFLVPEDGGSKVLQNTGIMLQHYLVSQPRLEQL